MTLLQNFLNALLRLQSALSGLQSLIMPRGSKADITDSPSFIFGQGSLAGQRLYAAKADLTACEVVSVYNALLFLGCPRSWRQVRREFFRRGALTLWFFGFFGGNPYSIKRVLRSLGVAYERVSLDGMTLDGEYVISFFNGRHPSLHTVFCSCTNGKWLGYNIRSNDHRPMPFDLQKLADHFILGYRIVR